MTVTDVEPSKNHRDESIAVTPESLSEGTMLADDDEDQEERGRIGYGPNERASSWLLGLVLVLVIAAIGVSSVIGGDEEGDAGTGTEPTRNAGPAPDFALTTFEGDTFQLSDHRGEVVIVNFWGSWCDPCREEMPAFQEASRTSGNDVTFVGVGSKRDREDKAREFADEFGVTYPIGLDSEGGSVAAGQITKDYNVSFYPTTFIIGPGGNISSVVVGQMDTDDLAGYIAKAREDAE
jgi:peroxiredoxin